MKRWNWISRMIACTLALCLLPAATLAAVPIQTGDYIQMGISSYPDDGETSILWRCVDADDPNGPLVMAMDSRAGIYPDSSSTVVWEKSGERRFFNQGYTCREYGGASPRIYLKRTTSNAHGTAIYVTC